VCDKCDLSLSALSVYGWYVASPRFDFSLPFPCCSAIARGASLVPQKSDGVPTVGFAPEAAPPSRPFASIRFSSGFAIARNLIAAASQTRPMFLTSILRLAAPPTFFNQLWLAVAPQHVAAPCVCRRQRSPWRDVFLMSFTHTHAHTTPGLWS